jgi:RAD2/SF2 helicase
VLNIEVYPLNCIICPDKDSDLDIIRPWAKNYIRWNEYWNKWQKRKVVTPAANYVFFRRDRKQVNILRTMFDDLIGYLAMSNYIEGVHYRVIQKKLDIDIDYEHRLTTKEGWTPRGEQVDLIDFASKKDYGVILMGLLMGLGKCVQVDTLVRIPNGWKRIGDLKVGDYVYSIDGTKTRVTGVYFQKPTDLYEVGFRDGRKAYVTGDHLWMTISEHGVWRVKSTLEVAAGIFDRRDRNLRFNTAKRIYLPLCKPVKETPKDLPINPYILGVLLGDGSFRDKSISITNPDDFIYEKIRDILVKENIGLEISEKTISRARKCPSFRIRKINGLPHGSKNHYVSAIEKLGLKRKVSYTKFIPELYMHGSIEQRYDLLNGLLDTDGYVSPNGSISFTSTSKEMAHQVLSLVYSLGGMGSIAERQKYYTWKGKKLPGRPSYDVKIRHPEPERLFTLPKKKCRLNNNNQYAKTLKNQFWYVDRIGTGNTVCISVEHESKLFLLEDYVVTHNTSSSLFLAEKFNQRLVCILRPGLGGEDQTATTLSTPIRVPGGWKKMGAIKVGDEVYAGNGDVTKVTAVHPQGMTPVYRLHFDGYRSVDCTLDHLFTLTRIGDESVDRTLPVSEIMNLHNRGLELAIPMNGAIKEGKPLGKTDNCIDTMFFIKRFFIDEDSNVNTSTLDVLISASYQDRERFVDLLLKTLNEEHKDTFRDQRVIKYIQELCFSLGYGIETTVTLDGGVNMVFDKSPKEVVLKGIERVADDYTQCISIDHYSQLYITKDYIVTHNSGWFKELAKATTLDEKEICVVRGRKDLQSLINMGLAKELPYRAILISNKTFQYYLKYYEEYTDEEFEGLGWNCSPKDLPNVLGVDTIFLDEVHLDSHLQCKMISYLGCKRILGASATIKPSSKFIDRMSKLSFPIENRYMQKHVTAYIQPTAFHYKFEKPQFIRSEGSRGYNHVKFEQSVMRHVGVKKAYFKMVKSVIQDRFISRFHLFPQSKCLVVVSTINMAKEMTTYLREQYPDLKVNSYVADDPQENVFGSNITVSTIGSSGVGLDIPDLNTVILTVAVSSKQTNLQVAGRLRFLGEGIRHEFIYFVCDDIASHVKYDVIKRNEVFPGSTCLNGVHWYSNIELGNRYANDKNR